MTDARDRLLGEESHFRVIVKPSSNKSELLSYDEGRKAYRIAIKGIPDKGKANTELVRFLTKLLKKRVKIVSGGTSRTKLIRIS